MKQAKRARLEATGWKVGTAAEFLGLSREEEELVELRVLLGRALKRRRKSARLTQVEAARRLGSSQSRVAKMEAAEETVSLDLLIRSLIMLGASRKDVARVISTGGSTAA
jgi:hypothetical protein